MEQNSRGSEFFWTIIADSNGSPSRLREILSGLSEDEVYWFHEDFVKCQAEIRSLLYETRDVESEDEIETISEWVVSQGQTFYRAAQEKPTLIPDDVDEDDDSILSGIAAEVFRDRFGKLLSSY